MNRSVYTLVEQWTKVNLLLLTAASVFAYRDSSDSRRVRLSVLYMLFGLVG